MPAKNYPLYGIRWHEEMTTSFVQYEVGSHISHSTVVLLPYCVYTDCHGWSSTIAIHKEILVFTFSFNLKATICCILVSHPRPHAFFEAAFFRHYRHYCA